MQLGLTAAPSAIDAVIRKKTFKSGVETFKMSYWEMDDVIKIVQTLEAPGLLIKAVWKNRKRNKASKRLIPWYIIRLLVAILWGYLLAGKRVIRAGEGQVFQCYFIF